jgi:MFS family permease
LELSAHRRGYKLVALLWIALGLNYVDRQMVFSIYPALRADLGFTPTQLGLIGSVFTWVYAFSMPGAGWLADRLKRNRMIAGSMVLWSLAALACGLSHSISAFLFWRAVMGVTEALYYPAAAAMLADAHGPATRSRALGIHQSAQLAGIVAGGWYGGYMADHWNWRTGCAIAAAAGLCYAAVLARQLPVSTPQPEIVKSAGVESSILTSGYIVLSIAFFAHCAMLWIFYAWLPSFLAERYHLSMTASGFEGTVFVQLACGAGVLTGSFLADRLSQRNAAARFYIAAAGLLLSAPFGYLTFAVHNLFSATLFSALYGYFAGLMIANAFAAAYEVVPKSRFGFAAGLLNMTGGLAATIMIWLAGYLKGSIGFSGLLQWVAPACMVAALALMAHAHRLTNLACSRSFRTSSTSNT